MTQFLFDEDKAPRRDPQPVEDDNDFVDRSDTYEDIKAGLNDSGIEPFEDSLKDIFSEEDMLRRSEGGTARFAFRMQSLAGCRHAAFVVEYRVTNRPWLHSTYISILPSANPEGRHLVRGVGREGGGSQRCLLSCS